MQKEEFNDSRENQFNKDDGFEKTFTNSNNLLPNEDSEISKIFGEVDSINIKEKAGRWLDDMKFKENREFIGLYLIKSELLLLDISVCIEALRETLLEEGLEEEPKIAHISQSSFFSLVPIDPAIADIITTVGIGVLINLITEAIKNLMGEKNNKKRKKTTNFEDRIIIFIIKTSKKGVEITYKKSERYNIK